jgi:hypothetical protein
MMAVNQANIRWEWKPAAAPADHPASMLPVYPLRQ